MTETTETMPWRQHRPVAARGKTSPAVVALLILIALGDFLSFGQAPGLNLFAFAVAAAIAIVATRFGQQPIRTTFGAFLLGVATALPLIEAPSFIGAVLAIIGLSALALTASGLFPAHLTGLPLALFRFSLAAPLRLLADFGAAAGRGIGLRFARGLVVWIVPAILAVVFIALFWSANPVVADILDKFDASALPSLLDPWRIAFWLVVAVAAWPLLRPRLKNWSAKAAAAESPATTTPENLLFGRAAILRSLLLFNVLFAIETCLDLTYLWGGAALPDGMTHAEYAHRGAYPLIVTALLAAAFVLAAMRRNGPAQGSALIRGLVYAWIAQNILLCISSILRLKLYVEVFSLTEWRIAAGIWMGLVGAGLALILLRILFRRSNEWLVAMNLGTLALTLYACAFIDFSAIIADFNVDHSFQFTGAGEKVDVGYLQALGPSAIPALDRFIVASIGESAQECGPRRVRQQLTADFGARSRDWRSWSFRAWRLSEYLTGHADVRPMVYESCSPSPPPPSSMTDDLRSPEPAIASPGTTIDNYWPFH